MVPASRYWLESIRVDESRGYISMARLLHISTYGWQMNVRDRRRGEK